MHRSTTLVLAVAFVAAGAAQAQTIKEHIAEAKQVWAAFAIPSSVRPKPCPKKTTVSRPRPTPAPLVR